MEVFKQSPLLQKHPGKCALCGKECELTFEHIPPRAAYNSTPVKPVSGKDYFEAPDRAKRMPWELEGIKYSNQQKGMGLYTLCQDCNNNTGSWYGTSYVRFAEIALTAVYAPIPEKYNAIRFPDIYPLRIIKQLCSMFCSINSNIGALDDLRKFVLNKESQELDDHKYRIQMYFLRNQVTKYMGYSVLVNIATGEISSLSELDAYPVGFQLIFNPKENKKYPGINITAFAHQQYDSKCEVQMPLIIYESNNIFPNDFRTKAEIIRQSQDSQAE